MQQDLLAREVSDEQLDLVFKALADRTRREQLKILYRGPATITELASRFDMSLPAASKHLRVLEKAGLIDRQKQGRISTCSFKPQKMLDIEHWLVTNQQFWRESLDNLADYFTDQESEN